MKDLTEEQLKELLHKNTPLMKRVFSGKHSASWRHLHYKAKGAKKRALTYKVPVGPFKDEQHQTIVSYLMEIYCSNNKRYLDYVLKVLVSEMLIAIYMDVHHISDPKKAEELMDIYSG